MELPPGKGTRDLQLGVLGPLPVVEAGVEDGEQRLHAPDQVLGGQGSGGRHDGPLVEAAGFAGRIQVPAAGPSLRAAARGPGPYGLQGGPDHLQTNQSIKI